MHYNKERRRAGNLLNPVRHSALFNSLTFGSASVIVTKTKLIAMKAAIKSAFLEEMKTALLDEKKKLETELASFAHRNPKSPDTFEADYPNFGESEDENAAEIAQYGDNLSLEQELESALKDVNSALKAVEDGSYGVCKYCKQVISDDRLRARPTSTSCIVCKKTLTQEM